MPEPSVPATEPELLSYKAVVEYDGTAYSGWQRQANAPTIQEALENALHLTLGARVVIDGSGRTDAGVHALGQVASFRARTRIPVAGLMAAWNARLPRDIAVLALEPAFPGFHARKHAVSKLYRYRILTRAVRPALERTRCHHVPRSLDLDSMRAASALLAGTHDFRAFACKVPPDRSCVRTVHRVDIRREQDYILVDAEADGFLQHMVRTIVGTLLEVGLAKRGVDSISTLLASGRREDAGPTAPPQGLYLVHVRYDAERRGDCDAE